MHGLKTVAIIQARMGSTRFPGKVLHPLAGKPVLWHVVHRLRKAQMVDQVAIATSTGTVDDPLVEFAAKEKVPCIRGPEDNVLERYRLAAEQLQADIIIRVTGDAPLVDPQIIDQLVTELVREKAEYCVGNPAVPVIHEGFCPFTRGALDRLVREAADDPIAREHVSAYFKKHPDSFHIVHIDIDPNHHFSGARVSVDTPADLRFLETVYQRLGVAAGEADMAEVVRLLKREPELLAINNHVYQKKAADKTRTFLFRCDGNSEIGLGHVVRCLALAETMRDKYGCGITFVMADGETGREMVEKAGFPIIYSQQIPPENSLLEIVGERRPNGLILDIRRGLKRDEVAAIRRQGVLVADIDDPTDLRLEADLAFYPPVPQVNDLDWRGFSGKLHIGWDWVILRPQFAGPHGNDKDNDGRRILVSMGGSDPAGLTGKVVELLANTTLGENVQVTVVAGAGLKEITGLRKQIAAAGDDFHLLENVRNMAELMAKHDLAIVSFGVTAYELAAVGTPAMLLCLDDDHFRSASVFKQQGVALPVPVFRSDWPVKITHLLTSLLDDPNVLQTMSRKSRHLIDGRGAAHIARIICEKIRSMKS